MQAERFLQFIQNPHLLSKENLSEMETLVHHFPYVQNIQLLYLFNLHKTQDIRFGEQLQKTATYTSNRKWLKEQLQRLKDEPLAREIQATEIEQIQVEVKEEETPGKQALSGASTGVEEVYPDQLEKNESQTQIPVEQEPEVPTIRQWTKESDEELIQKRAQVRSKAELLQLVKKRLAEIEAEKKRVLPTAYVQAKPLQSKMDIIDKFIQEEPSISRPEKTAFFDPDIVAQESVFDDGILVTETLATIYADQGNYRKAKEIYQLLILKYPEKSSYFAALIQELDKNLIK